MEDVFMQPGKRIMQTLFSLEKTVYTNKKMHYADSIRFGKRLGQTRKKHFLKIETGDE